MAARLAPQRNFITITQVNVSSDRTTTTATANTTTAHNEMALSSTASPINAAASLPRTHEQHHGGGRITIVDSADCKIITITSPSANLVEAMDDDVVEDNADPLAVLETNEDDEESAEGVEHEVVDDDGVSWMYLTKTNVYLYFFIFIIN